MASSFSVRHPQTARKVLLSARGQVDCMDGGLSLTTGAQEIISMISSRRLVTKLILGHNELGDDGTIVLFKFLMSPIGRRHPIVEISLNSNKIGDRGLLAISEYLKDNIHLKELFLQNNLFTEDLSVISSFTSALNTSRLETLSLTTNRSLGDLFVEKFLSNLCSPHLHELHLSAMGLTSRSTPYITEYLSSTRCQLVTLKCNGNALGLRSVRTIVRVIERSNYALSSVEMQTNHLVNSSGGPGSDNTSGEDSEIEASANPEAWKITEKALRGALARNVHLKRVVEKEASSLLKYARALLLHPTHIPALGPPAPNSESTVSPSPSPSSEDIFPFSKLPTEIQLHILSFFAPTLSSAQRIRIYTYASSPSTLPRILPSLPSSGTTSGCIPDPSTLPFGYGAPKVWGTTGGLSNGGGGCANGKCLGAGNSLLCHREEERHKWLTVVGCCAFERDHHE